ncbi:hypothetical protein DPX39_010028200 [Trypanosoma brucei equiperdum]|uniref:Uncharacterized protein n=1 Tax=Trypanosoma brucei equiperdum TaxID=630700 RepID=A0A3L6LD42_9TRYP|nr:hypothetical protein DPX39_010028200 [Trypanosoma brucei equiperdum]
MEQCCGAAAITDAVDLRDVITSSRKRRRVDVGECEELWQQINKILQETFTEPQMVVQRNEKEMDTITVTILAQLYRVLRDCWCFSGDPYDLFEPVTNLHDVTKRVLMTSGGYVLTPDSQNLLLGSDANMAYVGILLSRVYRVLVGYGHLHCIPPEDAGITNLENEVCIVLRNRQGLTGVESDLIKEICSTLRSQLQDPTGTAVALFEEWPLLETSEFARLVADFNMKFIEFLPFLPTEGSGGAAFCLIPSNNYDTVWGRVVSCGSCWVAGKMCAQSFLVSPSGPLIVHLLRCQRKDGIPYDGGAHVTVSGNEDEVILREWLRQRLWTPQPTVIVQWWRANVLSSCVDFPSSLISEVDNGPGNHKFERCWPQFIDGAADCLPAVWVRGLQVVSSVKVDVECCVCRMVSCRW